MAEVEAALSRREQPGNHGIFNREVRLIMAS